MPTCYHCLQSVNNTIHVWGREVCQACFATTYSICEDCGETGFRVNSFTAPNGRRLCWDCSRQYSEWKPKMVPPSPAKRLGSGRCFGIELETETCDNYVKLRNKTVFGAKEDGSIDGMEFVSPILSGDAGIKEVRKFCRLAKNFTVDWQCGFHLHIDLRDTTKEQRKLLAYAYRLTFKFWGSLVNEERLTNEFCEAPTYSPEMILRDYDRFLYNRSRYEFINWRAYNTHKTVEIRGYQGTLKVSEICNWIDAHLRFVDAVLKMSAEEIKENFGGRKAHRNLRRVLGRKLSNYYAKQWRERLSHVI